MNLLFDLDGTLVNTDSVYTEVWDLISKKYNFQKMILFQSVLGVEGGTYTRQLSIIKNKFNFNSDHFLIDTDFFNKFIKGKSDSSFLNNLLSLDDNLINEISSLKDELFIDLLKLNSDCTSILLPGVINFFKKIEKDTTKIAIVTSCNKKAAEYIIKSTGLSPYIDLLIASEDCVNHKPDPEPYLKAMSFLNDPAVVPRTTWSFLNSDTNNTIIFEDSYSGYMSAKQSGHLKIVLICNESSCQNIKDADEYKIKDYVNFDINHFIIK